MISFCQDLSISYNIQVYENKTVKKITHSRNTSNLSDKISAKSNKLTLVSKNPPLNKSLHNFKGISLTDSKRAEGLSPQNHPQHKRHFSNQFEMTVMNTSDQKKPETQIFQKQINFTHSNQANSIHLHQKPFNQRVHFNRHQDLRNINPQKPTIIIPQSSTIPSYSFVQSAKHITQQQSPFKNWELHQSQTIRINGSLQRLDQSRQTRKNNYEKKSSLMQNYSHTNSLASYETIKNFGKRNAKQSETQEDRNSQKRLFDFNKDMILQGHKVTNQKKMANISQLSNFEHTSNQNLQCKIILPEIMFPSDHFYNDEQSPLFDAASIVSKSLNDEDLDQRLSIVQQRNFFFQKEEDPNHAFKKSIEKFIFFETGYFSQNKKWVLFRNVQQKENKKIYSIKQFSSEDEKEYFDEYDVYLSLKAETSQHNGHCLFLQLFNALSNNEQKKLHLVKQPFEYLLSDYISYLKKKNTLYIDRIRILISEKSKLQREIEKVFQFFTSHEILIREEQKLKLQDFVICNELNGEPVVKFHSLLKLQKRQNRSTTISKDSLMYKSKRNKEKLQQLYEKIHRAFFFE